MRGLARASARRSPLYLQNTIIIGAGHIGQLAARKLLQHPEYGINLVGFVDAHPRTRRPELEHLALVGPPDRLTEIISLLDIERVIIAFSDATPRRAAPARSASCGSSTCRSTSSRACSRSSARRPASTPSRVWPLVGLPPSRLSPSSRLLKRSLDYVVALVMIVFLAPRDARRSPSRSVSTRHGPVLFRQRRLGYDMQPFTVLKFRTMRVDTDQEEHRRYIETTLATTHLRTPTGSTSSIAPARSPGSAASCARRVSTSCRSSSTSWAARCRSSVRDRASTTRPRVSPSTTSSGSWCRRA